MSKRMIHVTTLNYTECMMAATEFLHGLIAEINLSSPELARELEIGLRCVKERDGDDWLLTKVELHSPHMQDFDHVKQSLALLSRKRKSPVQVHLECIDTSIASNLIRFLASNDEPVCVCEDEKIIPIANLFAAEKVEALSPVLAAGEGVSTKARRRSS